VYASRISTALHAGIQENHHRTQVTLFMLNFPVQGAFLALTHLFSLGDINVDVWFCTMYLVVSTVLVSELFSANSLTKSLYR
jgi:solute carrier family 41